MNTCPDKNTYPTKNTEMMYGNYTRAYNQQPQPPTQGTQPQHFLTPYTMPMGPQNVPVPGQQLMYNTQGQSMYNIMYGHGPQSMYRNQNNYNQPVDTWNAEPVDSHPKNKENCCAPPITVNKNLYMDPQWFYGNYENQKYNELPSCSQMTSDECCNKALKSVKYCSIQKYPESYMYQNQNEYPSCSQQTCSLYPGGGSCYEIDKKILLDPNFYTTFDLPKIDKTQEESNGAGGESDIVVEESEEDEVTEDESEETETHPCLICNVTNETSFILTVKTPFTTYTKTPVKNKLLQLFGSFANNYLCSTCMNLIDTFDHLEMQLENIKRKILDKYKSTLETLKQYEPVKLEVPKLEKQKRFKYRMKTICGFHCFKCKICRKKFSLKNFYKFHMSRHKVVKCSYLCEHCGCNFVKHSTLLSHLRRHLNNYNIRCQKCNKGFIYSSSLNQHKCSGRKYFMCHLCGKIFKTGSSLTEHVHICSGNLPYSCKQCTKHFSTGTKLKNHIKLEHDKNYTFTCPVCEKGFVKQSDFKSHQLSHTNEKNYKCKTCNKTYKTLSNLNQHLKIHDRTLPFTCTVCQKGFLRKENLQAHLNVHNGLKPFDCTICNKKFSSQKNLNAHIQVHKGTNKKKSCPVCGKQISHGLQEHLRTHSNSKQFECKVCGLKFFTKGALAKHKKRKHDNSDLDLDIM